MTAAVAFEQPWVRLNHGCLACRFEAEEIGPLHGPEKPPDPRVGRWSMTPREWAGDGPLRSWGR